MLWYIPEVSLTSNMNDIYFLDHSGRSLWSLTASILSDQILNHSSCVILSSCTGRDYIYTTSTQYYIWYVYNTLFSECLAHKNHPNFQKPWVTNPYSMSFWSCQMVLRITHKKFYCSLTRPFDKLNMTRHNWENWIKSMCTSSKSILYKP